MRVTLRRRISGPSVSNGFHSPSSPSLHERCASLLPRLLRLDGFDVYFLISSPSLDTPDPSPTRELRECFRLGIPLCYIFNLAVPSEQGITVDTDIAACGNLSDREKKRAIALFAIGLRRIAPRTSKPFTVMDVWDETSMSGFSRVVDAVTYLVDQIPQGLFIASSSRPSSWTSSENSDTPPPYAIEASWDKAIRNFMSTQRSYIADLQRLHGLAVDIVEKKILDEDTAQRLFPQSKKLYDFEMRFLAELEFHATKPRVDQRWGAIFMHHYNGLQLYVTYCAQHGMSCDVLQRHWRYLNNQDITISSRMDLHQLLLKPVQRSALYSVFLKDLLDLAAFGWYPYAEELQSGYFKAISIVDRSSRLISDSENLKMLVEKVKDWKGHTLSNFGDLLLSDILSIETSESSMERTFHVYLFESIMMSFKCLESHLTSQETSFSLKGRIYMSHVTSVIEVIDSTLCALKVWWRSDGCDEFIIMKYQNERQLDLWKEQLLELISSKASLTLYEQPSSNDISIFDKVVSSSSVFYDAASQSTIDSFDMKLRKFKTTLSPSNNPLEWITANHQDIFVAIQSQDMLSDYQKHRCIDTIQGICLYPRLIMYVFSRLIFKSKTSRNLDSLTTSVEKWKTLDIVTSLYMRNSMKSKLMLLAKNAGTTLSSNDNDDLTLQEIIALDDSLILAWIATVLEDPSQKKSLLSKKGERAQKSLDLLQDLLNYDILDKGLRRHILAALIKLSSKSGLYPTCFVLNGAEKMGDYAVAAGSFGEVWKGMYEGEVIALKVLKIYLRSDVTQLLKRFACEAVTWRQLSHPNVLPFYGVYHLDNDSAKICLVSPWMANGNIVQFLKENTDSDRLPLVADIAAGLKYLHTMKPAIVHGDLKGVNILITDSRRASLADFGLATVRDSQAIQQTTTSQSVVGGTLRYQAPEILDGYALETPEWRGDRLPGDIYSFACVCYEIYSGNVPFHETPNDVAVVLPVMRGIRPSRPQTTKLSDWIWTLIEKCWAHDFTGRPTATEIVYAIRVSPHGPVDDAFRSKELQQVEHGSTQKVKISSFASYPVQGAGDRQSMLAGELEDINESELAMPNASLSVVDEEELSVEEDEDDLGTEEAEDSDAESGNVGGTGRSWASNLDLWPVFTLELWKQIFAKRRVIGDDAILKWFHRTFDAETFSVWHISCGPTWLPSPIGGYSDAMNFIDSFLSHLANTLRSGAPASFVAMGLFASEPGAPEAAVAIQGVCIVRGPRIRGVEDATPPWTEARYARMDLARRGDRRLFDGVLVWNTVHGGDGLPLAALRRA